MAVQPPPERFRDVLDACAQGFGAPRFSDASAEREQTVWELDRTWVVEDDGRYVATATSYAFEMTVPGGARVPAAGVAQVAVLPTHRRRGHLRDVMGAVLAQVGRARRPLRHPQRLRLRHLRPLRLRPGRPGPAHRAGHRPRRAGGADRARPHPAGRRPRGRAAPRGALRPLRSGPTRRGRPFGCLVGPGAARRGLVAGDRRPLRRRARGRDRRARRLRRLPVSTSTGTGAMPTAPSRCGSSRPLPRLSRPGCGGSCATSTCGPGSSPTPGLPTTRSAGA